MLRYRNHRSEDKDHKENPSEAPLNKRKPAGTKRTKSENYYSPSQAKEDDSAQPPRRRPDIRGGCAVGSQAPQEAVQYQENPSLSEVQP